MLVSQNSSINSWLRTILDSSPNAITVTDLNGNITECNQATVTLHGCSSKEELIGKSAFGMIAKKDHERAMENLKKTLEQGEVRNLEYTLITKDGREFPAELSSSVIKDSSGKTIGFVAITQDITESKRMEEEIKRLANFTSENPNPVLRLNQDGVVLDANKASEALLRDWRCKIGGNAPKYWRDFVTEVFTSQSSRSFDVELGKQVYAFFVMPVKDHGYVNLYGIDVTDRKRMQEELRESEEKFRGIAERSFDIIFTTNLGDRLPMVLPQLGG